MYSDYVTIIDFPLQQLLHECASMLRYTRTYIACIVNCTTNQLPMTVNVNAAVFMVLTPRELADRH